MTPAEQNLARELAAHPEWRWAEGMRAVGASSNGSILAFRVATSVHRGYVPDLSDPATQGCLIAALGDRCVALLPACERIEACVKISESEGVRYVEASTLGEALSRAWLAVHGGVR